MKNEKEAPPPQKGINPYFLELREEAKTKEEAPITKKEEKRQKGVWTEEDVQKFKNSGCSGSYYGELCE